MLGLNLDIIYAHSRINREVRTHILNLQLYSEDEMALNATIQGERYDTSKTLVL
jgi:hypothetical protein